MLSRLQCVGGAVLAAGVGLLGNIGWAADSELWPAINDSHVQMVTATEEAPIPPAPTARQLDDAAATTAAANSMTATYPPKPAAKSAKPAKHAQPVKAAAKPDEADLPDDGQPAPKKPTSRVRRATNTVPYAPQNAPRYGTAQRDVQIRAHYMVEGDASVAPKKAAAEPTPPGEATAMTPGDGSVEGCADCGCFNCTTWCGGMDYLFLRPHFGNNPAFQASTANTDGPVVTTTTETVNFKYDYDSDFRFFIERKMGDGELRFGYTHIQADDNQTGTASGVFANGAGTEFRGLSGVIVDAAGSSIAATTHLTMNIWDLDRLQRLNLPGCFDCSAWEVQWGYGLRLIQLKRTIDEFTPVDTENLRDDFEGAGPRIGFEARRHFGAGRFSAYINGDAALLLGHTASSFRVTTPGELQTTVADTENSITRIAPNFELSVGVVWQPTCHTTVTTGWLFETFTDSVAATSTNGCTSCGNAVVDSGNILSFDGLFVRLEQCF